MWTSNLLVLSLRANVSFSDTFATPLKHLPVGRQVWLWQIDQFLDSRNLESRVIDFSDTFAAPLKHVGRQMWLWQIDQFLDSRNLESRVIDFSFPQRT